MQAEFMVEAVIHEDEKIDSTLNYKVCYMYMYAHCIASNYTNVLCGYV